MTHHKLINPEASFLKFKLPWTKGSTKYLDGSIYLPIWGPVTTSETRMVAKGDAGMKDWDNTQYESQMFHFNTHTRVALYPHPVESEHVAAEGICHCFDCTSELHVLKKYLLKFHTEQVTHYASEQWEEELSKLVDQVTKSCSSRRTLLDANPDPEERKKRMNERRENGGFTQQYAQ